MNNMNILFKFNDNLLLVKHNNHQRLITKNLKPGNQLYGENIKMINNSEYRTWDPFRSKMSAAILNSNKNLVNSGDNILYLGASTGTTVSHLSDIVGSTGLIYGIEVAHRVASKFIEKVVKIRNNVIPIIIDARYPEKYVNIFDKVDIVYCDIAQQDQTFIAIKNCLKYLKVNGYLILVIKARSIDVTKNPKDIFKQEIKKLKDNNFKIMEEINLEPFDHDHMIVYAVNNLSNKAV